MSAEVAKAADKVQEGHVAAHVANHKFSAEAAVVLSSPTAPVKVADAGEHKSAEPGDTHAAKKGKNHGGGHEHVAHASGHHQAKVEKNPIELPVVSLHQGEVADKKPAKADEIKVADASAANLESLLAVSTEPKIEPKIESKFKLDKSKSPEELVKDGILVDKTAPVTDAQAKIAEEFVSPAPPRISVDLEDKEGKKAGEEVENKPNFIVKADGKIEMHGDPEAMKDKDIKVVVERPEGQLNPSQEQQQSTEQLVSYLSNRLKEQYPEQAQDIVLADKDNLVSDQVEEANALKQAIIDEEIEKKVSKETKESVGETRRFKGAGGTDMPMSQSEHMGSFDTRHVPRLPNESDQQAATKEAWAGLYKPDKHAPYETIRPASEGGFRVGRYGFTGNQLEGFLAFIGDPPDPALIDKLIKEGKLPKDYAEKLKNPEFLAQMKAFAHKLKDGQEQVNKDDLNKFLPKEAQEGLAVFMVDQMKGKLGDNPGLVAAALVSGKSVDTVGDDFANSPVAQELSEAGKTLYQIAIARQNADNSAGRVPTGARRELIENALRIAGVSPTENNIAAVNTIVQKESGWHAGAVNNWDSNAAAGHPSKGLMQTIPSTFKAYAVDGLDDNILDPTSNLVAGIRYAKARYGSLSNVPGIVAMSHGNGYKGY
jgi:hypothetical protein